MSSEATTTGSRIGSPARRWGRRVALSLGLTLVGLLPNFPGMTGFREMWYPIQLQDRIFSAAFLMTVAAFSVQALLRRSGRYSRWRSAAGVAAVVSFGTYVVLYGWYVIHPELTDDRGSAPVAVIVGSFDGSSRPGGPSCLCTPEQSNDECIQDLTPEPAAIDECWGETRMRWIRHSLVASYLLTSGSLGAMIGLLTAPREMRTVLPRPLPEFVGEEAEIFVSHSNQDEAFAAGLVAGLRRAGATVFFAPESIRTSDSFVERLNHALDGCRVGVLLWSAAAARSRWVANEINVLIDRRNRGEVRIQVVRLEPLEVPALLRDLHRIDAFPSPDAGEVARMIFSGFEPATTPSADGLERAGR